MLYIAIKNKINVFFFLIKISEYQNGGFFKRLQNVLLHWGSKSSRSLTTEKPVGSDM